MKLYRFYIALTIGLILALALIWLSSKAYSQDPTHQKIESDDPLVVREDEWGSQNAGGASGGSYLYNPDPQAEAALTLAFSGTSVEVVYVSGPTLGTLALEVDGTVLRTVITTADKTSYGQSTRIDYLTNEDHILRVYAQAGDVVGVDAFIILAPNFSPLSDEGNSANVTRDVLGSGGWMATYFRRFPTSTSCTIPTLTDSPPPSGATMYGPYPVAEISFDWGSTGGPDVVAPTTDTFGIIFRRTVTFAEDTTLTINYWADDGIRMYDNGVQFTNRWGCYTATPYSTTHTFSAGSHNLEIQYVEISGSARIAVTFSAPLLEATRTSATQVHLAWTGSFPNETDYRVERSPVGTTNWVEIATLPADSASYDDTGLTCGTYTYRVRAYFGSTATYSPYSNAATVDTGPCMGNPPTNLTATVVDFGQIRLDWTDNASDETEYRLERSWDGVNYWLALGTVAADMTTFTNSGLPCNLTYYYRVRGYRASDTAVSAYSNVTSATTRACLEAPPSNLTATALDGNRIQLNWTDTTTGETEFWIDRAILSLSNWYFIGTVPGESTSYTDTDLDCNTSYQYHIEAHRAGDGDWSGDSNSATATTGPCLLVTPTALTATPLSDGQIRLTWSDTNSNETEYRVERSWDGVNNWAEIGTTPANTTTYINISLDCATPYYYRVRAYRTADMAYSAYSEIGNATTLTCPTNCTPLGQISRVSLTSTGAEAATGGDGGAVSFDGRYVAFTAGALVSEDTNNRSDVYLRDNMTCQLWRVSVGSDGRQSDNTSGFADMSDDGRYVVFISFATNLDIHVLDEVDYDLDVYVHDRLTGQTRRLSATADGTPGTDVSYEVKISANGHYAIFASQAPNLPAGDTFPSNGTDFFIVDLETNAMSRVILPIPTNYGIPSPPESFDISGDGNTIVFTVWQPGIVPEDTDDATDLFIYDRPTNQVSRVLLGMGGVQANNGGVGDADVSYSGQYITFASLATNIVPNDTNGQRDVFVYDRQTSQVSRVSVSSSGVEGNNTSWRSTISIGGRYVTFVSLASNLVAGDTNGMYDVFVHDRQTAQTIRVSTAADGTGGDQPTTTGHISGSGQWVVFPSKATNLVNGDANVSGDVFMADLAMYFAPTNLTATPIGASQITLSWVDNSLDETTYRIERSPDGISNWVEITTIAANTTTYVNTSLDCRTPYYYRVRAYRAFDGSYSAYSNIASATASLCSLVAPTNLTATPFTDSQIQLTWVDNASDETEYRIERSPNGTNNWVEIGTAPVNTTTYTNVSLLCNTPYFYRVRAYRASDMTYSAYSNGANATTAACPASCPQSSAGMQRVSESSNGAPAMDGSTGPHSVSDDGRYVVFSSSSSNLVPNDTFPQLDIFVRDTVTCQTTLVSVASNGTQSNDLSWYASISGDGRYVIFESDATTLDPTDTTSDTDIFVHDRQIGVTWVVSHSLQNPTVGSGYWPMISGDGHYAVFTSEAALISSDTNGVVDVYLRDLQTNTLELISLTSTGGLAQSTSAYPYISYDGRYVTFLSYASLVPDVTSGFDVYWLDRMTGELQLASYSDDESLHGTDHRYLNQSAFLWPIYAPVTDDGRYVAFATVGPMTPDDVDEDFDAYGTDVFVRDIIAGTTTRISVDPLGDHFIPSMSSDGRYLTFASTANRSNMGFADTDVFLVDTVTGTTRLISRAYDGRTGNYGSAAPTISRDGRYIAFYSNATNLIQNGTAGVYLADTTQLIFTLLGAPNQARVHITWNNEINLRWDDPNPNETSYLVERSLNSSTEWTQMADLPADTKSLTDPSLVACTTYYYRVRAYRASDAVYSPYSNVVSIAAANCPPTTPTNLSASSLDASQIRLTWVDNAPNETSYRVERSDNGTDGWIQIADLPANTMTYTDSGLICSTGYYYRVRAYRGDGRYSAYSNVVNTTTSACPLIVPTNLTATARNDSQIQLTWGDSATDETEYRIERSPNGTNNWVEIGTAPANTTIYTNVSLICNTPYFYRVRAYRASDMTYSAYSNTANATTSACLPDALTVFNPMTHTGNLIRTLSNPPTASDYVYYTIGFPYGAGGQYVMGDWNGDGLDTMGVYRNGAFWYTNDYGQTANWTGIWFGLGGQAIAGRFNGSIGHDCIGVTDSGTWTTGDTFFALYFTCNLTSGPTPSLTYQWLSIVLPTSAGHSGTFQFSAGDLDGDGVDSIAIRRGNYIAWTNVPPTTLLSEFSLAQYFGAPGTGDEGKFVIGDWDLNNMDSFGLVYQNGRFYRRNDLQWNSGVYTLQQFTPLVGTPFGVTTWRPN